MLHMVSLFVFQMIGKRMPKKLQGYGTNNITKIIIIAVAYTNLIVWKHYKNNTHSIIDIHNTLQANRSRQYYIPKLIAVCVLARHIRSWSKTLFFDLSIAKSSLFRYSAGRTQTIILSRVCLFTDAKSAGFTYLLSVFRSYCGVSRTNNYQAFVEPNIINILLVSAVPQ